MMGGLHMFNFSRPFWHGWVSSIWQLIQTATPLRGSRSSSFVNITTFLLVRIASLWDSLFNLDEEPFSPS